MHGSLRAAAGLLACWLGAARAEDAQPAPPAETPAELAAFLSECAARLGPEDEGLARVARVCPGVEFHVLHGPLAGSLRDPSWAANVDAASLRELASVATTYVSGSRRTLDHAILERELARVRVEQQQARSWWERVNDWLERRFAQAQEESSADNWLHRLLRNLFAHGPDPKVAQRVSVGLICAFALGLVVIGWWKLAPHRRRRASRRRVARFVSSELEVPQPSTWPDDLRDRLCARFARQVALAEATGLLPGALALSCTELSAKAASHDPLAVIARAAPLVERARYAAVPPAQSELAAADASLATLDLG